MPFLGAVALVQDQDQKAILVMSWRLRHCAHCDAYAHGTVEEKACRGEPCKRLLHDGPSAVTFALARAGRAPKRFTLPPSSAGRGPEQSLKGHFMIRLSLLAPSTISHDHISLVLRPCAKCAVRHAPSLPSLYLLRQLTGTSIPRFFAPAPSAQFDTVR